MGVRKPSCRRRDSPPVMHHVDAEQIDFAEIFKRRLDRPEAQESRDLVQHNERGEGMRPGSSR